VDTIAYIALGAVAYGAVALVAAIWALLRHRESIYREKLAYHLKQRERVEKALRDHQRNH
jgi:hypothetical protein